MNRDDEGMLLMINLIKLIDPMDHSVNDKRPPNIRFKQRLDFIEMISEIRHHILGEDNEKPRR